jgi:hypothetical protein
MEGTIGLVERISTACPASSWMIRKLFIAAVPCLGAELVERPFAALGAGGPEFCACMVAAGKIDAKKIDARSVKARKVVDDAAHHHESRLNLQQDGGLWDDESVGRNFTAALDC